MEACLNEKNIINIAKEIFKKYKICDNCFGRLFKKIECNKDNEEICKILRQSINILKKTDQKECYLCSGLLNEINNFVFYILNSLNNYEFDTFLV